MRASTFKDFWRSLTAALRLSVQGQMDKSGEPRESGYVTRRQDTRYFSEDYAKAERLVAEAASIDRNADIHFGGPYHNDLIDQRDRRRAEQKRLEARLILAFWDGNR